jgi:hypothetical protein
LDPSLHFACAPTEIVKVFKGITALRLFRKFPDLRR